ncbi:sulfurtransferase TusA family protein [Paenibacillus sp. PL2-23]|uniref:sulfurtransferase TusA family protein n=1 Tax=Paenibacillus sp. PL2-23 TaxID=2100729 RepID=UPI0030FC6736
MDQQHVHIHADVRLDCKGLACPMPIVRTRKAIADMDGGQVLEVLATDKGSLADLKAWSSRAGHQYLGTLTVDEVYRHYIRKQSTAEAAHPGGSPIPVVSNAELQARRLADPEMVIIDVREEAEFAFGHVRGAISIPLGQLEDRLGELDRERELMLLCRTGTRSEMACRLLVDKGFKRVHNVVPGMSEWDGDTDALTEGQGGLKA